jgi:hypothetical protein
LRDDGVEGGLGGVAAALRAVKDGTAGLKDGGAEKAVVAAAIGSELVKVSLYAGKIGKRVSRTWKPIEAAPADSPKMVTFL